MRWLRRGKRGEIRALVKFLGAALAAAAALAALNED
jgi:hypothetical protein